MRRFTEQRRMDKLSNGKTRCYYNEQVSEETITTKDPETGEETVDTHAVYDYDTVDIDSEPTKGVITDALIRIRYSQSAVEAIMRHALADAPGAQEEFEEFNTYAEWCKGQAERILEPEA